ncbi:MAG: ectoine hydrolase DoeA [Proteobacteria bacterium]|nr:MAG: ectoine hydrolase DoeA [Pseudomonadota bacterium]
MPDVELSFTREEYGERLNKVRAAMESAGIEVLITVDPSNMSWLTGYDGWSFYTHQAIVVTLSDGPFWWGRGIDANGARRTVYMPDENILEYPDHYVMSTDRHPMDHLSSYFRDRMWDVVYIGVEMDNYYFSAAALESLKRNLPNATFVDATGLVNWQRGVKSETELEYMRIAARIVEKMHERIDQTIKPGIRKNELVAEIYHQAISGADGHGGDYPAIVPMLPTGVDASAAHLTWDDRELVRGAGTFFEIAGCYKRYHVPLCRTTYLGKPPKYMLEAEQAIIEGLENGLEAARTGNRASDVANAFYAALERAGIEREGRCGYPVGLSYPPDWGERTISFRETDNSVLLPGMTFHFMPGLWMDSWGLEITETILIKEEGPAECLANVPRGLSVKD